MKVLITGENGYVGDSVGAWLKKNGFEESDVSYISLLDDKWKERSFSDVDVILHCAALVHKKQSDYSLEDYKKVNTYLTLEVAEKAKNEGVGQFIFMSTKGVYGMKKSCYDEVVVTANTPLQPHKKYGVSKREAEIKLLEMNDETFRVAIIRAPLIYGKGCSGNYRQLRKMVLKYRFVPKMPSRISMLYIDNLCELIRQIALQKRSGVFTPQNLPIHSSSEMAVLIAKYNGKKVLYTRIFNPIVRLASKRVSKINSAFGSSIYAEELSVIEGIDYQVVDFEKSIELTEK